MSRLLVGKDINQCLGTNIVERLAALLPARIVPQDGIAVSVYTIQYIYIYIEI